MFTLIGLGVIVAYGYSVIATFFPGIFPESFKGESGTVGVYFEAAAVIAERFTPDFIDVNCFIGASKRIFPLIRPEAHFL
jgi:hypothetical protein